MFIFDPLNEEYKSVIGAAKKGTAVKFRAKCGYPFCTLVFKKDGGESVRFAMRESGGYFETDVLLETGLYFYRFDLPDGISACRGEDGKAALCLSEDTIKPFQFTVYSEEFSVPEWNFGGIIYQIFPDRFNEGVKDKAVPEGRIMHKDKSETPFFMPDKNGMVLNNDFYGGDIKGITEKLPYLKSLSVTAIYLNPIFSSYSNHRYDTGDYFKIDPLLGSMEDLDELIEKAGECGIKVILDGVFSHTGDDSVYFDRYGRYGGSGVYVNPDSPFRSWYKFIKYPEQYEAWWGVPTLPAVDKDNADYAEFIAGENGVLAYYTKKGIGGWRLDVADELPEKFLKRVRSAVKKVNKDAVIIGEVWEDASNKISYGVRREYFQGKELDSVMNYPLKDAIINYVTKSDCAPLYKTLKEQADHYPQMVVNGLMNILATHDTIRLLSAVWDIDVNGKSKSRLAGLKIPESMRKEAVTRLKAAVLLQYTLPGIPSVYYGDEIGMQGFTDPLNRGFFEWENMDGEILSWYIKLGKMRKCYTAFEKGKMKIIHAVDGGFVFKREDGESAVLVAVNMKECPLRITFNGVLTEILSLTDYTGKINLRRGEVAVLVNKTCRKDSGSD